MSPCSAILTILPLVKRYRIPQKTGSTKPLLDEVESSCQLLIILAVNNQPAFTENLF